MKMKSYAAYGAVALLTFMSSNLFAQTRLEEIVVTAQKRSESVQDVPIAITALSADLLQSTGVSDTLDLGNVTPGLSTVEGAGSWAPYIRGIGGRILTPGNEVPTATYIDGIYQTDKSGLLLTSFGDVESISVLRGPQGTLFGRNATAGAIQIATRMPSQETSGSIDLTYGSDEIGGNLFFTGGLSETVSASISAFTRNEDGYIKNLNPANGLGGETGDAESDGVRVKLLWQPSDTFSALLAADHIKGFDTAAEAVQFIPGTDLTIGEGVAGLIGLPIPDVRNNRPVYAGEIEPRIRFEGDGVSLTLDWNFDGFDVKSISAYRDESAGVQLDLDGLPAPISLFFFETALETEVFQQEITIASNNDSAISWIGGLFYIDVDDGYAALDQNVGLPYPYDPAVLGMLAPDSGSARVEQVNRVAIKSIGLFGEFGYAFNEATKLTLGLRYTDEEHTLDGNNFSQTILGNGAGGLILLPKVTARDTCNASPTCDSLSTSFDELTWRIVLDHRFGDDTLGYVSYNRGFKSGVYNVSTTTNIVATEPEIVDAYEIGIKSTMLDGRLSLNAALYLNDYSNMQVAVTEAGSNTQISINAAEATISGLELESKFQVSDNFFIQGGFSTFFESEYDSFADCGVYLATGFGNAQVSGDCTGQDLPVTPDYTFYLSGDYTIPLNSGSRIVLNGLFSYQDEFDYAIYAPTATRAPIQNSIETLNLSLSWYSADDKYRVKVWGKDVLDPDDVYKGMFTTAFGFASTYSRGATYGLTVGYDF